MVVVTVFDSHAQLDAAIAQTVPVVRDRVTPLTEGVVERHAGGILLHLTA